MITCQEIVCIWRIDFNLGSSGILRPSFALLMIFITQINNQSTNLLSFFIFLYIAINREMIYFFFLKQVRSYYCSAGCTGLVIQLLHGFKFPSFLLLLVLNYYYLFPHQFSDFLIQSYCFTFVFARDRKMYPNLGMGFGVANTMICVWFISTTSRSDILQIVLHLVKSVSSKVFRLRAWWKPLAKMSVCLYVSLLYELYVELFSYFGF